MKPLDTLSAGQFEECLEETFHIETGEETVAARLVEVGRLESHSRRPDKTPFSLLFEGPSDKPLEQRVYRLANDTLGELELFLVTLGPDAEGDHMIYEAVFT